MNGIRPLVLLSREEVCAMYPPARQPTCVTADARPFLFHAPPPFDPTHLAPTLARLAASEREVERLRREDARRAEEVRFAERFRAFIRDVNRRRRR